MMLMCVSCGAFVKAVETDGQPTPVTDECPECDGTEFKDTRSGRIVDTSEG